jgi:periplasmic protein TonB
MSDLGTLSQCMMDSDPETMKRSRWLRRKALGASLFLETLLVATMLVWPLITPGVLPPHCTLTPIVPFSGVKTLSPIHSHAGSPSPRNPHPVPVNDHIIFQPPHIPAHVDGSRDDAPPVIGETSESGEPGIPGTGPGIGVPDSDGLGAVPPPPQSKLPRKVSIGVMEASLINRVQPDYPVIAKNAHISGEVKIRATIGTDGAVKDYVVVSGSPLLSRAALDAVRQWRYRPTKLNGEPVEVETLITVNFVLQ